MSLLFKQIQPNKLYTVAYKPGLNGMRWGLPWKDGISEMIPGALLLPLKGKVNVHLFPYPIDLEWQNKTPVEREAVAVKLSIPQPKLVDIPEELSSDFSEAVTPVLRPAKKPMAKATKPKSKSKTKK
jgi:hypothetical protein